MDSHSFTTNKLFHNILKGTENDIHLSPAEVGIQTDRRMSTDSYLSIGNIILNFVLPVSMAGSNALSSQQSDHEMEARVGLIKRLQQPMAVLAGSSGEGLGLPDVIDMKTNVTYMSDQDIKYVFTSLVIDAQYKKSFAKMDTKHSPPGFARLVLNKEWLNRRRREHDVFYEGKTKNVLSQPTDYVEENGYINRKKITRMLRKELSDYIHNCEGEAKDARCSKGTQPVVKFSYHGPAVTVDIHHPENITLSKDYVIAFPCPQWPVIAQEWIRRKRHWPSAKQIKHIASRGCHIVPKMHHSSTDPCEFIISFSVTEKYVAQCLSIYQKRVYLLLKFLFKYYINKVERGLTTYHIKTVFFRTCEEMSISDWTEINPHECLQQILIRMESYIQQGILSHYFIPSSNLIDNISKASMNAIVRDIQSLQEHICEQVLALTETKRFCWLSKDISLPKLLQPILQNNDARLLRSVFQNTTLKFVAMLLQKGETHVALSLMCGTMNCDIRPTSPEIVLHIESILESNIGNSDEMICIKGLLASVHHHQAIEVAECVYNHEKVCETCEKCGDGYLGKQYLRKSFALFKECLPKLGDNIWLVAEYYNLLSRQDKNGQIVRHFISNLHCVRSPIDIFQGGIYTTITSDNDLSTDESFIDVGKIDDFCVPSTAYIFYKVIKALTNLKESSKRTLKCRIYKYSEKLLKQFERWAKEKFSRYGEDSDENVHVLLGLSWKLLEDDKKADRFFQNANDINAIYTEYYDDLQYVELPIHRLRKLTRNQIRSHPYKKMTGYISRVVTATNKASNSISTTLLSYRPRTPTLKAFVHY